MAYKFETTEKRSALMRKIKSANTTPEQKIQKALKVLGVKFTKNCQRLPGKPDIAINNVKIAIFIDGEFWHGYKWKEKKKTIKANRGYWIPKIERNIARDAKYQRVLRKMGWRVIRFWQHQIAKDIDSCISKTKNLIRKKRSK